MSQLYRLVYTSFRKPGCTDEEINNILLSCKKNNPGKDITGVLLHSEKRFIQYMEGGKEELEQLYNSITTDKRHTAVHKRSFTPIDERLFPSWEMAYRDLSSKAMNYQTSVSGKDKITFDEIFESDQEINDHGVRLLRIFAEVTEV